MSIIVDIVAFAPALIAGLAIVVAGIRFLVTGEDAFAGSDPLANSPFGRWQA